MAWSKPFWMGELEREIKNTYGFQKCQMQAHILSTYYFVKMKNSPC